VASSRRIAVVGGGPAGLACAIGLLQRGHAVTIFEKGTHLGGTPESVIPGSRFESAADEIDAILAPARAAGRIEIRFGQALGRELSLAGLRGQFDALFLACGLEKSTSLGSAAGVVDALGFLRDVKAGRITSLPAKVAVLGAGNTAMDAAVTARWLRARDVYVVYRRSLAEMPAWPDERDQFIEMGGHLLILTQPLGYVTDGQRRLRGLRIARTTLGSPDASGRRAPQVVPDSESVLEVEMVIEALGQGLSGPLREAIDGLALTRHGLVATQPDSLATSLAGVYAGGDLVNGGTTAVRGIAEGMRAAEEISRGLAAVS
jgi:NADPH-dependent glutamate synthase beta subunit-like oxidoreductase